MSQNNQQQTRLAVNSRKSKRTGQPGKTTSTSPQVVPQTGYRPKRPVGKMLLFGAMSISAYLFLFSNETLVTKTFTLGGWHAAFPVMTAFAFSFVHGAFASNLLSVLGIEARK